MAAVIPWTGRGGRSPGAPRCCAVVQKAGGPSGGSGLEGLPGLEGEGEVSPRVPLL